MNLGSALGGAIIPQLFNWQLGRIENLPSRLAVSSRRELSTLAGERACRNLLSEPLVVVLFVAFAAKALQVPRFLGEKPVSHVVRMRCYSPALTERWTPFFGQGGSEVKVDAVGLVGTLREPLDPSGVPGSGVDNRIRCAPSKLSTLIFSASSDKGRLLPAMGSVRRPGAERILPSACGHRQGSSEVVPRCSSASTHRSFDERRARPGKHAGRRTRT